MNADKEKWIDGVMNSTRGKAPVSVNRFLYEQLLFKVQRQKMADGVDRAFVYKWAAVIVLLVGINGAIISNAMGRKANGNSTGNNEGVFTEMTTQVSYNY